MLERSFILSRMSPRELADFRRVSPAPLSARQAEMADRYERESHGRLPAGVVRKRIELIEAEIAALANQREELEWNAVRGKGRKSQFPPGSRLRGQLSNRINHLRSRLEPLMAELTEIEKVNMEAPQAA